MSDVAVEGDFLPMSLAQFVQRAQVLLAEEQEKPLPGDPTQETGGVMVTLAALCDANHFDMTECAEAELARIWGNVVEIRAKQAAKPKHSPLPSSEPGTDDSAAATRA